MREVLHRGDLALYANGLTGIEVQLQGYNVIGRCAIGPGSSGCLENYSLTTNGNFGPNDVPLTQSSFYLCRHKRLESHTIFITCARDMPSDVKNNSSRAPLR